MMRLGPYAGPDLSKDQFAIELRRRLFEYLRRPEEQRAQRRVPVDEKFLYSDSIAQSVKQRCRNKCFFCEQKALSGFLIDHFRPVRDARDFAGHIDRNHYAWLAYEADNLILICGECAAVRGTMFPVEGERAPYMAILPEVRRLEQPLLVDAYHDRTDQHFDFLGDGWCEPLTDQGRATVIVLDLNRSSLIKRRRQAIDDFLRELAEVLRIPGSRQAKELVDSGLDHVGARLNVMKRVFQGLTFAPAQATGNVGSLIRAVQTWLTQASRSERDRAKLRIETFRKEDSERLHWDNSEWLARFSASTQTPREQNVALPRTGGVRAFEISNFKGIGALKIELNNRQATSSSRPCLMLLGENAVGKSSILQAIALALIGGAEARRLRLDLSDFLHADATERWDQLAPGDARADVSFTLQSSASIVIDGVSREFGDRAQPACLVLGYGPRRFFDPKKSTRAKGAHARVRTLFSPTATIPYPGTWLNEIGPQLFDEVARVLRIVLALGEDDELVRDLDGRICVRIAGTNVPIERLSEGYKSVFAVVTDIVRELIAHYAILQDAEAVVLIDEIETHLHPRWKRRVMQALRTALPNVQFIVTTHDPLCLSGMDDGEVQVLQRRSSGAIELLPDLPSIKGMRADQLLTSDYFGLASTIDPETELSVAKHVAMVQALPEGRGSEADDLISHLTIGDDAKEQVIHEAMSTFIAERERPAEALRTEIREEAIRAVLAALNSDGGVGSNDQSHAE